MLKYNDYKLKVDKPSMGALKQRLLPEIKWFHHFEFTDGTETPGADPSSKKLHHLGIPMDLSEHTVLDVGTFDGYFAFQCEQRGARKVVASDKFEWDWPGSHARDNFMAVHKAVESKIEIVESYVEELSNTIKSQFDIVLFLGVLYHAPDPVGYIRQVAAVTKHVCICEALVDGLDAEDSIARLYRADEINNDASNYWGVNLQALEVLFLRSGFARVEFVSIWDVNPLRALVGKPRLSAPVRSARIVIHAYK